jgi:hypothetical protein
MFHVSACLVLLLAGLRAAGGQTAAVAQFVSADLAAKTPARLVLRQAGLMNFITDPNVDKVVIRGELELPIPACMNMCKQPGGQPAH